MEAVTGDLRGALLAWIQEQVTAEDVDLSDEGLFSVAMMLRGQTPGAVARELERVREAARAEGEARGIERAAQLLEDDPDNTWDWTDPERNRAIQYAKAVRALAAEEGGE